mgnify:CR=1 FL=1
MNTNSQAGGKGAVRQGRKGLAAMKVAIVAMTLAASPATAVDWSYLAEDQGIKFYMDFNSIKKTDAGYLNYLMKYEFQTPRDKNIYSAVQNVEVNCSDKQSRIISITTYDRNGSMIQMGANNLEKFAKINPDSMEQVAWESICPKFQ